MKSLQRIYDESPTLTADALLAAFTAQPAEGRRSPIQPVRSWISANFMATPLRKVIANADTPTPIRDFLSEFMDGLALAESFDGTDERIFAAVSQVVPYLVSASVMTQQQANELLAFVVESPTATLDDAAAVILAAAKDAALVALETHASGIRNAVNAAASIDAIPTIPTL